jgi:pilus assembly protein Flp/PilA
MNKLDNLMINVWVKATRANKGQSLAEYGLILALIAVFCIVSLTGLGQALANGLTTIANAIQGAIGGA